MQASRVWSEENLRKGALASMEWQQSADLPDPLDLVDFAPRSAALAHLARRRVEQSGEFSRIRQLGYPKKGGGRRVMSQMDPIDELIYRHLVGRVVPFIHRGLDNEVMGVRTSGEGPFWMLDPWQIAQKHLRADKASLRNDTRYPVVGHLDTRSHYPTVSVSVLCLILRSLGCDEIAVIEIDASLRRMHDVLGQPPGLPIGPEGSAPLGTVALLPVDRVVRECVSWWRRWVDDYTVGLEEAGLFAVLVESAALQHEHLGQALNVEKCWLEGSGEPESMADSMTELEVVTPIVGSELLEWLAETSMFERMPFVLGGLRRDRDPSGVSVLQHHPEIVARLPKETAKYLLQLDRSHIDEDWLGGIILSATTDDDAASQLWMARVVSATRASADLGAAMFIKATELDRARYAPLANQMLSTAGRSRENPRVRRKRAVEFVEPLDDFNGRRAALAAFFDGSPSHSGLRALVHLERNDPELVATTAWAAA